MWCARRYPKRHLPGLKPGNQVYTAVTRVYELFVIDDVIREMTSDDFDVADIRRQEIKQGLHPLRICGAEKISAGLTTVDEILRVVPADEE